MGVPLDRSKVGGATIPIAFVLTPHTGSGPAVSAIVMSNGGPVVVAERTLLPRFATGTPFVTIANGGHVTSLRSGCAAGLETLHKIVLHGARFAEDVRVTGQVTFTRRTSRVRGNIAVTGALRVSATLWDPKHPTASVKGTVGSKRRSIRPAAR